MLWKLLAPILSVSKASVPLVRCSRRSSSDSGCFHQKCADEAMRNRRWCRWLLPTKEKPLSYVGWAQDKGIIWKDGLGGLPLQCKIYVLFNLATLYSLRIIARIAIFLINTRYYSKKAQTLLLKWCTLCNHNKAI